MTGDVRPFTVDLDVFRGMVLQRLGHERWWGSELRRGWQPATFPGDYDRQFAPLIPEYLQEWTATTAGDFCADLTLYPTRGTREQVTRELVTHELALQ